MKLLTKVGLTPTPDAHLWTKKWSTWLSALQLSFGGAAMAYALLPTRMQEALPDWIMITVAGGVLVTAFLLPAAVNTVQKRLQQES
jgi:hypothetical protein